MEGFFPRIAEGMLHGVGQPTAKGGDRSEGVGHGKEGETFSMLGRWALANGDLLGFWSGLA
jgi:hypothetical protein